MLDLSKPFAVIQKEDQPLALVLTGGVRRLDRLEQIPLKQGRPASGRAYDTLSLVPFSQIKEKGFEARQGDEALLCMQVEEALELPLDRLLAELPEAPVHLEGEVSFEPSEEAYRAAVTQVIEKEIGEGEGANFVLPRLARGRLKAYSPAVALGILKRLLRSDYGSYWKYVFFDGTNTFVGSTPEKHLSVDKGKVVMNPISGTYRKQPGADLAAARKGLMDFLADPKEINELFMVVDEELKMMSKMCEKGGMIVGPLMKEMSRLIHTEYLLVGESGRGLIDLLRESMFAATVTGSPVENACRLIARYEATPRRYYASSIALLGRDGEGEPFLDSPILIRSLEIAQDGGFQFRVGATLVRDSQPEDEVAETKAKGAAVLGALLAGDPQPSPRLLDGLGQDALLMERLHLRNQKLSTFWFYKQEQHQGQGPLRGMRFECIDNEDDFLAMFGHMLEHLGASVRITPWKSFELSQAEGAIVVPGPGPGNPSNLKDPKIARNAALISQMLKEKRKFLAVCLGHQVLCGQLGLRLGKKKELTQGVQKAIDYFGRTEEVGFYNTFCGFADPARKDLEYSADAASGEIHALRGAHFAGVQFHPESILSRNGYEIVREAALRLR